MKVRTVTTMSGKKIKRYIPETQEDYEWIEQRKRRGDLQDGDDRHSLADDRPEDDPDERSSDSE